MTRAALLMGAAALLLAAGAASADVTKENFTLRTTGDLVALCGVSRSDPNAAAAIHFCHGYYVGIDQFAELTGRPWRNVLYCPPEGLKLSRNEVVAMVVDYHRKNPQHANEAPVEGIIRWASATWPCKK
ncbi:MAG TPA: Rap1a/Tai family immunity protein [Burkholderiales bacterium]|nr:Rap1a/Tai family immunity protein [Burkholderiales bacterium]